MEENQNPDSQNSCQFVTASKELFQVELYNVTTYLERLTFVLHTNDDLTHLPQIKNTYIEFLNDIKESLSAHLSITVAPSSLEFKASAIVNELTDLLKLIELYFKLQIPNEQYCESATKIVNALFLGAHNLHLKVKSHSILEVQTPRFTLAKIQSIDKNIPFYQIEIDNFSTYKNIHEASVNFINERKEELYERNLARGHFFLLNKNYVKAKEHFIKAKNFKTTSEVFTLLGHLSGRENRIDEAKEFCLKAIKTEPEFGAPYNDYGVYLLNEGLAKDALKWFSLAKKSLYYQNRDFAFINTGRAYFAMGEYELVLDEFTKALTINPENKELETMVHKIKENLETKELREFILKFKPDDSGFELNQ